MRRLAAVAAIAVTAIPLVARAEQITIEGCPEPGIEAGCIIMRSAGKLYNISAAKPRPQIGVAGRLTGTPSTRPSHCMQGTVLAEATWEPIPGASCEKTGE